MHDDPQRPPLHYWREPPLAGRQRLPHWKGIVIVVVILLAPAALLAALMMVFGAFR